MTTVEFEVVENNIDAVKESIQQLDGAKAQAGIWSDEDGFQAMKAIVHERGVTIEVTEAMRGFFLANFGVRLRDDTNVIEIPPRPFVEPGIRENIDEYSDIIEAMLGQVVVGDSSPKKMLTTIAERMASNIRKELGEHGPPLSGLTIQAKGSAEPLVDTGRLRQAIRSQVDI